MYTVSIVEDEHLINEKIKKILVGLHDKIKVVGQYSNGLDALNAYEQNGYPDIIISDICMPNVSGIELAKTIKNKSNHTQIIIISGYADFEFMKQAIEIKVSQYLLKPIKINELIFSVEKCIDAIEEYNRNIQLSENRQHNTLNKFIFNKPGTAFISDVIRRNENLKFKYYSLLVIHNCDEDPSKFTGITLEIERIVVDMRITGNFFPFYEAGGVKYCYVVFGENDIDNINAICNHVCKELIKQAKTDIKLCYTICPKEEIMTLKERNDLSFFRRFVSEDVIFSNDDFFIDQMKLKNYISQTHERFSRLIVNLTQMSNTSIRNELIDISRSMFSVENLVTYGYGSVRSLFTELFTNLYTVMNQYSKGRTEIINSFILSGEVLHDFDNNQQLNNFIISIISAGLTKEEDRSGDNSVIEKAKKLVYENYGNPDFSLSIAANELYLNSSYLSRIFKEETGYNFSYFTNYVKIEKSKQLLATTEKDIVEIAFEVGYNNQQYFSKIFKSYTGLTPHSYRHKK